MENELILRLNLQFFAKGLDNPKVVITGFDRKNLYYSVEHISGKNRDIEVRVSPKKSEETTASSVRKRNSTWKNVL